MIKGLLHAHSGLRWILLALLVGSVFNAFKKWKAKEPFTDLDNKLSLFTFITAHIQLLLGIALYFMSDMNILENFSMKIAKLRFFGMEHSIGMLLAIVLITLARIQSKKITEDTLKHKKIFVMFLIAFVLIIISIPWPFRGFGNAWF